MSGYCHDGDIWPSGDSITDTIAAASTAIALPTLVAGDTGLPGATAIPKRCRIATNSVTGVWFKVGLVGLTVSAAGDASDGVYLARDSGGIVVITAGQTHIAHFGTAGEFITITPLND